MPLPTSLTTVTPFSRLLALALFIILPITAFYFGTSYGKSLTPKAQSTALCPKLTPEASTCMNKSTCSDEAKECPDGSYVFREQPNCNFAACPSLKTIGKVTPGANMPKNGATKQTQIAALLSQKTGIPQLELIITYINDAQTIEDTKENTAAYDGGTYSNKENSVKGRWIAAKINGSWNVTSLSTGIPKCSDVNPYYYPKTLVPACKDAKGNITAR
jgi:hypothetical protein